MCVCVEAFIVFVLVYFMEQPIYKNKTENKKNQFRSERAREEAAADEKRVQEIKLFNSFTRIKYEVRFAFLLHSAFVTVPSIS